MTRAPSADARIVGLAALLTAPRATVIQSDVEASDPTEKLEQERCRVIEAARQEGYVDGMARAEKEITAATEQVQRKIEQAHVAENERLAAANRRAGELLQAMAQATTDAESTTDVLVAEIAYAAVVRFLGETLTDGSLLKLVCRKALEEYRQRPVILRVPVDDVSMLRELSADASISIEGDARLMPGQCRLQTHKGDYDTSLEVRLDALKLAFLRSIEAGGTGA